MFMSENLGNCSALKKLNGGADMANERGKLFYDNSNDFLFIGNIQKSGNKLVYIAATEVQI
jgi:hypothetical protein